jgi:transglutaminase-like putative cysteine protease
VAYEAYTRTPADKKLKVSDFKTADDKESFVFYDDVKETTFNFPAVEPGAVGNLNVSWIDKEPHLLSPFYFTGYLPALNCELRIEVSGDISIKYVLEGLDTSRINVQLENKRRGRIYTFLYKNCPEEPRYADAPNFSWYAPHVIFYIDHYLNGEGNQQAYLSSTDDLYKLNYGFIRNINRDLGSELKHTVDSLIKGVSEPREKAMKIYSWVQQQIKYVAFEQGMEGFIPRDANLVCSRRFGDCKDMSSILTMMLNAAGVPAYFTWIGTRDLPYRFTDLPLPLVSNHMICTIRLGDSFLFLDGTDPTCVFGYPSYGIQGKQAMVALDSANYKILTVPVIEKDKNISADTTWLELDGNSIHGRIKKELKGYYAMQFYGRLMYENGKTSNEDLKDEFSRGSNKFKLDTFAFYKKPTNEDIVMTAGFTLDDYAKKLGDEIYLNLNLFKFFEHQEIDYPKRKIPIEYHFKSRSIFVVMLKLPQGYRISYLPKSKTYHNAVWGFDLDYEQKGDWVILKQQFGHDQLLLNADQFQLWNQVLENLYPMYKETLSLSKN